MRSESTASSKSNRILSFVVVSACIFLVVLQRYIDSQLPVDRDVAGYAVIGHEMMRGRELYSDLWERKPPLLYVSFAAAECLAGYGPREIFLLSVLATLVVMMGVYFAGTACHGRIGGLFAIGLWTLLCGDMFTESDQPNGELFVNACITCSFALVLHFPRRRVLGSVLLGILFAAATLYKHHSVVLCVAIAAGYTVFNRSDDSINRKMGLDFGRLRDTAIVLAVVAVAWGGLFLYFFKVGRLDSMIDVLFKENAAYAGNLVRNLAEGLTASKLFPPIMSWAIWPLILVAVAAVISLRERHIGWNLPAHWKIWACWAIATFFAVALPSFFYPHYYQMWIPVFCVAGGWSAAALLQSAEISLFWSYRALILKAVVVFCFVELACRQIQPYRLSAEQRMEVEYPPAPFFNNDFFTQTQLARSLDQVLLPHETFWNLGWENTLYFVSHRSPPSGILYQEPLERGANVMKRWQQLMDDLNRVHPDLVVISLRDLQHLPKGSPVFPWLSANYVAIQYVLFDQPGFQVVVRRDSPLLDRLRHAGGTTLN